MNDAGISHVQKYLQQYLQSLKISAENIQAERCNFYHHEPSDAETRHAILNNGFAIIKVD